MAEHVCHEFGPDGREVICGHPSIELGMIELGRFLGEPRYIDQGRLFLERRGRGLLGPVEFGQEYFQDDRPIADATVLRGHAVRAMYLTAAAADSAQESSDAALLAALEAQLHATVARRMYLTGGVGSRQYGEAFGVDWELPPDGAYCETCAGVGTIMVAWRLLLATGDAQYGDLIERVLLNVVATSPAADGHSFFYSNRMQQRIPAAAPAPDRIESRVGIGLRAPWYEVSCCPPNVSRTLASAGAVLAAKDADGLRLIQFASAEISTSIDDEPLELSVTADYPQSGVVEVSVREAPANWTLRLRVPVWASGAVIELPGEARRQVQPGWAEVASPAIGTSVRLVLPVEPRFTFPDPRIDAIRGHRGGRTRSRGVLPRVGGPAARRACRRAAGGHRGGTPRGVAAGDRGRGVRGGPRRSVLAVSLRERAGRRIVDRGRAAPVPRLGQPRPGLDADLAPQSLSGSRS